MAIREGNIQRKLLNFVFSPTKQIPTLSGRSAVDKPFSFASSLT